MLNFNEFIHSFLNQQLHDFINGGFSPNFLIIALALAALAAGIFAAVKVYGLQVYHPEYYPEEYNENLNGFKGLMPLIFGVLLAQIVRWLYLNYSSFYMFDKRVWAAIADTSGVFYNEWWMLIIPFYTVTNVLLLVYAVLITILFAKRKRIFRRLAIYYMLADVLILGVKYVILSQIFTTGKLSFPLQEAFWEFGMALQLAFVFIPYFLYSKRIHSTLRY